MGDNMKKRNLILSIVFFIVLFSMVVYVIFSNHNFNTIVSNIKLIDYKYVIVSLLLVFAYFLCQGIFTKYILKVLDVSISLFRGIYYSIVEFLFNAITPGATGGQPVQLFYMSKDEIPMTKSLIMIIMGTIIFKLYLIVGSIFIIIFKSDFIFNNGLLISIMFWVGIALDVFLVFAYLILMYNQKIIRKILDLFYRIKSKILKKPNNNKDKIDEILNKYVGEAVFLKEHPKELVFSIIITFIQRTCLFSITYVLYRGFGFNSLGYCDLLLLQIFVQITIEAILLPGGLGAIEYVTNNMYLIIYGTLSVSGMIVSRTVSFYIPLLIIMFIVMFMTRFKYYKNRSK